jgi:hypothetical protein
MILAFNKTRNSRQLFNDIRVFNEACQFHELEILSENYTPGDSIESESDEIKVKKILPKININEYSVKKFRENIENFTAEDLKVFIDTDNRATIVREAKKELKNRK